MGKIKTTIFYEDDKPIIVKEYDFGDDKAPAGWYKYHGEWFLTWDALKKEFKISTKHLVKIVLTDKGECELRTVTFPNPHDEHTFKAYSLDDARQLVSQKQ